MIYAAGVQLSWASGDKPDKLGNRDRAPVRRHVPVRREYPDRPQRLPQYLPDDEPEIEPDPRPYGGEEEEGFHITPDRSRDDYFCKGIIPQFLNTITRIDRNWSATLGLNETKIAFITGSIIGIGIAAYFAPAKTVIALAKTARLLPSALI